MLAAERQALTMAKRWQSNSEAHLRCVEDNPHEHRLIFYVGCGLNPHRDNFAVGITSLVKGQEDRLRWWDSIIKLQIAKNKWQMKPPAILARIGYNPIPTNRPFDRNLLLLCYCFAIALRAVGALCGA